MKRFLAYAFAVLVATAVSGGVRAQETNPSPSPTPSASATPAEPVIAPMYVDRPSVSNTAHVVGDGSVQLEQGLQFTTFHSGSAPAAPTVFNAPLRLRVGVSDDTEFRLESSLLNLQGSNQGFGDLIPGFKHNFYETDGLNLALVVALEIPTGAATFRAAGVVPTVSITSDWVLADDWGLLVNVFLSSPYDGLNQRILEPTGTVFISHAFSGTYGGYIEFAAFGGPSSLGSLGTVGGAPVGAPGTTLVDGGFNVALNPTTAIDFDVFRGLTHGGFNWGGTVGFAKRW